MHVFLFSGDTDGIRVKGWEHLAADRSAWRLASHNGAQDFEERRLSQLDINRQARKERKANPAAAVAWLSGVWKHLCIGVWSAVTPKAPMTYLSLRVGQL